VKTRRLPFIGGLILLSGFTVGSVLLSLSRGDVPIPAGEVVRSLLNGGNGTAAEIVRGIRLPRALAAAFSGGALAAGGAIFQAVLENPLAEPYTLGVASGAALGAATAILLGLPGVPLLAFLGGLTSLAAVVAVARGSFADPVRLVLSGVVVGSVLQAALALAKALAGERIAAIVLWILGSFAPADAEGAALCGFALLVAGGAGLLGHRALDLFAMGGVPEAQGMNASRARTVLLLAATLAASLVVGCFGVIGFVGLLAPHLIRLAFGPSHGRLLPLAILFGAGILPAADTAARALGELPVGVLTALLGGPVFCAVLWRR
jgi:iron complex transport system permease protein